jgi:hypothetical protein
MEEDKWVPLKRSSVKSILKKAFDQRKIKSSAATSSISNGGSIEDTTMISGTSGRGIANSMFASETSLEVRGGTEMTLDALAAYLKYLEGTGNASWQEYVSPTNAALQLNSCSDLFSEIQNFKSTLSAPFVLFNNCIDHKKYCDAA